MAFDFGNASGWTGGVSQPQKVTDLSPHVDGGLNHAVNATANMNVSDENRQTLWLAVAYCAVSIALLWWLGALVFRNVKL